MTGPIYRRERRDANEPAIRAVCEDEFDASFVPVSVKDGPDAFVGLAGLTEPWEIKDGAKKLRPGQARWAQRWKGRPAQTVRNEAQARKRLRMMATEAAHIGGGADQACDDADVADAERTRRTKGEEPA
jgi:hypothetical protein